MAGRTFVDASVLVRLFDDDEPARQAAARALVGATGGPTLVVSGPVLAEFVDAVTRMARPLTAVVARRAVHELAELTVVPVDAAMVLAAEAWVACRTIPAPAPNTEPAKGSRTISPRAVTSCIASAII